MNHFAVHLKLTQHCKSTNFNKKNFKDRELKRKINKTKPIDEHITF